MRGNAKGPVHVPSDVLEGILAVRKSGLTNMLDINAVARIALEMGHDEAAAWIACSGNKAKYADGIFYGFESSGGKLPSLRPGAEMRYIGKTHPSLTGLRVKVVKQIDQGVWEFSPWVVEKQRFSWITSDALESELEPLGDDK